MTSSRACAPGPARAARGRGRSAIAGAWASTGSSSRSSARSPTARSPAATGAPGTLPRRATTRRSATTSWPARWPATTSPPTRPPTQGAEADASPAQARLALTGAAERAAALGGYDQAVAYLDQALAITTDPAERAPLLDRAAGCARASAARDAEEYGEAAIDAYRDSRPGRGAGRHRALRQAAHRRRRDPSGAPECSRPHQPKRSHARTSRRVPGSLPPLPARSRRPGLGASRSQAADRALAIAERLNLEPIVAEAIGQQGIGNEPGRRRREAIALGEAALRIAQRHPSRNFEMRIRNNLAAA